MPEECRFDGRSSIAVDAVVAKFNVAVAVALAAGVSACSA